MAHPCSGVVRKLLSVLRAAPKQLVSAHDTQHLQPPPALPFMFRNEYKVRIYMYKCVNIHMLSNDSFIHIFNIGISPFSIVYNTPETSPP